jgi:NitT/TauT family transport system substrate-binding protein
MTLMQTRRCFLAGLSGASVGGALGARPTSAAEAGPETTRVRFGKNASICVAPQYYLQDLLRAEGFTEISYIETTADTTLEPISQGTADFSLSFVLGHVRAIDAAAPITILAGVHAGCYELFARDGIRNIAELKGKTVGVQTGSPALLRLMAAGVGLDPRRDLQWVTDPSLKPLDLFAEGKIDAFLGFPPEPQILRARRVGHVILNTTVDAPWSQYYCCLLAGNREFVARNPAATKRVLRAILKATDLCVADPAGVAQRLVGSGFTPRQDYAEQTLRDSRYDVWRDYDAEDTVRFYALRLHEAGMIKSSPQKIIADGTDFRFLDAVKRELKT